MSKMRHCCLYEGSRTPSRTVNCGLRRLVSVSICCCGVDAGICAATGRQKARRRAASASRGGSLPRRLALPLCPQRTHPRSSRLSLLRIIHTDWRHREAVVFSFVRRACPTAAVSLKTLDKQHPRRSSLAPFTMQCLRVSLSLSRSQLERRIY